MKSQLLLVMADLTVLAHLLFIFFVVFGGLLVWHRRWVAWVHLPAALWGALVELAGWVCPLTPLENRLRSAAGQSGYESGFIDRLVTTVIYPPGLTREVQLGLGLAVIILNLAIYTRLLGRAERTTK